MSLSNTISAAIIAIATPTIMLDAAEPANGFFGAIEAILKLGVPGLSLLGLYVIWKKSEAGDAKRTEMHGEQLKQMADNSAKIEQLLRETLTSRANDRQAIDDLAEAIRSVPCRNPQPKPITRSHRQ